MFKFLNENEMMMVNGGFYYVPVYDQNGNFLYTRQVASNSGIKYFKYELVHVSQYRYEWRYVAHY